MENKRDPVKHSVNATIPNFIGRGIPSTYMYSSVAVLKNRAIFKLKVGVLPPVQQPG